METSEMAKNPRKSTISTRAPPLSKIVQYIAQDFRRQSLRIPNADKFPSLLNDFGLPVTSR